MPQPNELTCTEDTCSSQCLPPTRYTQNINTQLTYAINFEYVNQNDVVVISRFGTTEIILKNQAFDSTGTYTINEGVNPSLVTFTEAPGGDELIITRLSDICKMLVVYEAGASIRAEDLNAANLQLLNLIQENYQEIKELERIIDPPIPPPNPTIPTVTIWSKVMTENGVIVLTGLDDYGKTLTFRNTVQYLFINGSFIGQPGNYLANDNGTEITLNAPGLFIGDEVVVMAVNLIYGSAGNCKAYVNENPPDIDVEDGNLWYKPSTQELFIYVQGSWQLLNPTTIPAVNQDYTYPGGVTQTIQNRLEQYVSVTDFGADPTGTVDCTTEFQNAVTYSTTNFIDLHIPAGVYLLSSPITIEPKNDPQDREGVKIFGDGTRTVLDFTNWDVANFRPGDGGNPDNLYAIYLINDNVGGNNWTFDYFELSGFKVVGPNTGSKFNVGVDRATDPVYGGYGPDAYWPSADFIEGLHGVGGPSTAGGYLISNISVKGFDNGFRFDALQFCGFYNLKARQCRIGLWHSVGFTGAFAGGNSIQYSNCYFTNNYIAGIALVGANTAFPFQIIEFSNSVCNGNTLTALYAFGADKVILSGLQTEQSGYYNFSNDLYNLESTYNFTGPDGAALTIRNAFLQAVRSTLVFKMGPVNTAFQPLVLESGSRTDFNDGQAVPYIAGYVNSVGDYVNTISEDSYVTTTGYTPQKSNSEPSSYLAPIGRLFNDRSRSIGNFIEHINIATTDSIPNSAVNTASAVYSTNYPATVETGFMTTGARQFLGNDAEYGTVQQYTFVNGDSPSLTSRLELSLDGIPAAGTDPFSGFTVSEGGGYAQFLVKFSRVDESIVFNFNNSTASIKSTPQLKPDKWYLLQMLVNNRSDTSFTKFFVDIRPDAPLTGGDLQLSIAKVQAFTQANFTNLSQFYRATSATLQNQSYNPVISADRYIIRNNSPEVTASKNVTTGKVGDVVYNATPTAGGFLGWVCVTAGTPGTWKQFGQIQA